VTGRSIDDVRPLTAEAVVDVAGRVVELHGIDALTMRRLSDELGVAVTSIYWHVGNRQQLLDALVERLLADMGIVEAAGIEPRERIASLARDLRTKLLDRPHLVALAHERGKTAQMFEPVQAAIVAELADVGLRGEAAALALRSLQLHVVGSVLLERTLARRPDHPAASDPPSWLEACGDAELAEALRRDADRVALFEFGLRAILLAL
jgi:AcrR family transcriptional regulator